MAVAIPAGFLIWRFVLPTRAAAIVVNSLADTTANDGDCTLREAIDNANNNASTWADCAAGAGNDTITFNLSGTIILGSQLPNIADAQGLTIDGVGQTIIISGNNAVRVFYVDNSVPLTLQNLTVANGNVEQGSGGAGVHNFGSLTIDKSTFSSNIAGHGGAIDNYGIVNISNSTFSENNASGFGGAIGNYTSLIISNSTFSDNSAGTDGTAIAMVIGLGTITNSTFSGNTGSHGMFTNVNNPSLTSLTLKNTIVNTNDAGLNCRGVITNGGNNLENGTSCGWDSNNGSMSNTNPTLGSLQNNGGPTDTFALLPGSPAIDGVIYNAPNDCPATDQRGIARPQGPRCDIGAYESTMFWKAGGWTDYAPSGMPDFDLKSQTVEQLDQYVHGTDSSHAFGVNAVDYRLGQGFVPSLASVTKVVLNLAKVGNPSDGVKVRIYDSTGAGGFPGNLISGDSSIVPASTIPADPTYQQATFTFSPPVALTPSNTYWIVFERTGPLDNSNYYRASFTGSNSYAPARGAADETTIWDDFGGNYDFWFEEYGLAAGPLPNFYDGPTALADSFWWFDSKFEPNPVPPPAYNDGYPLIQSLVEGKDDHDPSNVAPVINEFAEDVGTGPNGTSPSQLQAGIATHLGEVGLSNNYTEQTVFQPSFSQVEEEVELSQDTLLLLGYWFSPDLGQSWCRLGGHWVTSAGVDSTNNLIAFSDPYFNEAELGNPGRVLNGTLIPHNSPDNGLNHNDAGNISHDIYGAMLSSPSPGNHNFGIANFPYDPVFFGLNPPDVPQGPNCPNDPFGQKVYSFPQEPSLHVEVEYMVDVSPVEAQITETPTETPTETSTSTPSETPSDTPTETSTATPVPPPPDYDIFYSNLKVGEANWSSPINVSQNTGKSELPAMAPGSAYILWQDNTQNDPAYSTNGTESDIFFLKGFTVLAPTETETLTDTPTETYTETPTETPTQPAGCASKLAYYQSASYNYRDWGFVPGDYRPQYYAQSFTVGPSDITINRIVLPLAKTGSPTDSVDIDIRDDNSGIPGTVIPNGVAQSVLGSSLPDWPTYADTNFNYSTSLTLNANTKYWIVATRATGDNSNFYFWRLGWGAEYTQGEPKEFRDSNWQGSFSYDALFDLQFCVEVATNTPTITETPTETPTFILTETPTITPTETPAQGNCIPPPSGMISWWPGDDNTNDIQDANNGAWIGNPGYAPGMVSDAFAFDGTNAVSVPDNPNLDSTAQLTADGWFYWTNDSEGYQAIFGKDNWPQPRQYSLVLTNDTHSSYFAFRAAIETSNNGFVFFDSVTQVQLNQWYHAAITYDGAAFNLYVNGILDTSLPVSGTISTNNGPFAIGIVPWDGGFFHGLIDEVEVYERALTQQEIAAIYEAGSAGKCKQMAVTETPTETNTPSPTATATQAFTETPTATIVPTPTPEPFDLGDAPDSSNTFGIPMFTYGGVVPAHYPTVYGAGSPPWGPKHSQSPLFLGTRFSREGEADIGLDDDFFNNIIPGGVPISDNLDEIAFGPEDGLQNQPALAPCQTYNVSLLIHNPNNTPFLVNVWFDYNRDGDWDDSFYPDPNCPNNWTNEWVVNYGSGANGIVNIQANFSPPSPPNFMPDGRPVWMRITISSQPIEWPQYDPGTGGSGPQGGYPNGETEDYYLPTQAEITPTPTETFTETPTNTSSPTATATQAETSTETPTETSTEIGRPTDTSTETPTDTVTNTFTSTATLTYTATSTFTSQITSIFTDTATATLSATPTFTGPTLTPTNTGMPTNTATITNTPTRTLTFTPTRTFTVVAPGTGGTITFPTGSDFLTVVSLFVLIGAGGFAVWAGMRRGKS